MFDLDRVYFAITKFGLFCDFQNWPFSYSLFVWLLLHSSLAVFNEWPRDRAQLQWLLMFNFFVCPKKKRKERLNAALKANNNSRLAGQVNFFGIKRSVNSFGALLMKMDTHIENPADDEWRKDSTIFLFNTDLERVWWYRRITISFDSTRFAFSHCIELAECHR